jgi:hypothetical protein
MQDQITLQGAPGTPAAPANATLLKELLRQRHLKYETFCASYERTAAQITADDVPPSPAQFHRWISGQLKGGKPYPDACRVLESMFLPWTVAELFAPYRPYEPGTVPEWARESTASIARDHPETLPGHLYKVAEIEAARRYGIAHPVTPPPLPDDPRECLHLFAVRAWRCLASGQPAPALDLTALGQGIYEAFGGDSPVDELCDEWLNAARQRGITVDGEDGEILPDFLETISQVITAAFWSGLTTGHYAITREFSTPHKFRPYFQSAATGSRGGW